MNLETIFSVILGGVITLVGSFVAHHLQYLTERRNARRRRIEERHAEVRRYILHSLEFAKLAAEPLRLGPLFGPNEKEEWLKLLTKELDEWKSLPVRGSARALFVTDESLLGMLKQIDRLMFFFYIDARKADFEDKMAVLNDELIELREKAIQAAVLLDDITDNTNRLSPSVLWPIVAGAAVLAAFAIWLISIWQ